MTQFRPACRSGSGSEAGLSVLTLLTSSPQLAVRGVHPLQAPAVLTSPTNPPKGEGTLTDAASGEPHSPERAKASADLMLGSMGIPGAWDSGGAQA